MSRRFSLCRVLPYAVSIAMGCAAGEALAKDRLQLGKELFERKWTTGDVLCPDGDGLGPMFNAASCVACHFIGGTGGAGQMQHNVALLSALPSQDDPLQTPQTAQATAAKLHAGFQSSPSLLLHHLSTEANYEDWRLELLGFKQAGRKDPKAAKRAFLQKLANLPPVEQMRRKNGCCLLISQRSSTSLFGAGLIDSIPENTLHAAARQQSQFSPGIRGRVCRDAGGKVSRFGWRGQAATLRDFVLNACAMELGLQTEERPQAPHPMAPKYKAPGNDLNSEQAEALVAFVASLPAPEQVLPDDPEQSGFVRRGEQVFQTIGCAACHIRDLGTVHGIFSDLLLHDMGPELEDPVGAFPELEKIRTFTPSGSIYGGGFVDQVAAKASPLRREWKTPPLWGVRDTAPYLHDGRAATLEAAIAAHGGQGESSAKRFAALDDPARHAVMGFLNSLAGPTPP